MAAPPVPLLLLCSVTSTDSAIDLAVEFDHLKGSSPFLVQNPSAAFIFASLSDAQYLANSVDADFTCINNFPAQLMVGPKLPKLSNRSIAGNHGIPRYSREMFEECRTVILKESPVARFPEDAIETSGTGKGIRSFIQWTEDLLMPLKPTGQPEGMRDDIFGVGIMIGLSMIGLPLVAGLGFLGKFAIGKLGNVRMISR